ncbi:diaminopimelate epimerase [Pontixanthobacter aestiaquae]|uniref:Diaminopimelate epimerase n=1 Tax=Pontixanthobacter aestiaquae TaxID=1509367 RepID=A0A844Z667_9SPHN|nr:diaminopimelate epimerase [Pontixanthobacter aestiaquae]MDN3645695.1 diaminopimelate epimerase [Pontixanthobacter aestiaquae]MXO83308.1 diaminopimelate epimerase [Pontixanthobacter aestiaquae]
MRVPFIKMHGLGNDFIMLDAREAELPAVTERSAAALANRRTGIGCDQLILLERSANADFRMRIFNSDGGEVEACGNAARAAALLHGEPAKVETDGGIIELSPTQSGARVDMGVPSFEWDSIPLDYAMDTAAMPVSWEMLGNPSAVNVGNPHVIFFVRDCEDVPLDRLGPLIENDPLFPTRINVNIADIRNGAVNLRVWERGAGLTRACGTGACATAVAAIRRGLVASPVTVNLPGGPLQIEWNEGGSIIMEGPATEAYRGTFEWADYA